MATVAFPPITPPLLFLSGAGLPSWIWDDVCASIPSETRVAEPPRGDATLADYTQAALDSVDGWNQFAVVAHSIGGVVGCELVALASERVIGLLGVSASIPDAGQSFLGALPFPQRYLAGLLMRALGTRPPSKAIRDGLCLGVDTARADRIVAEFTPESQRLYRDRLSPRTFPSRSAYVVTRRDTQFPPSQQQRYAARLPGPVHTLDTAHLPMLEHPHALTGVVMDTFGRERVPGPTRSTAS